MNLCLPRPEFFFLLNHKLFGSVLRLPKAYLELISEAMEIEMAQGVKVPVAELDLSSVPGTHTVGRREPTLASFSLPCT